MADCSVRVICRFRPFNEREKKEMGSVDNSKSGVDISFPSEQTVNIRTPDNPKQVVFIFSIATRPQFGFVTEACLLMLARSDIQP